jgi:hypothetical protein
MFCGSCGANLPDESKFCHSCGNARVTTPAASVVNAAPAPVPTPTPVPTPAQTKGRGVSTGFVVLLLIVFLVVLGWWVVSKQSGASGPTAAGSVFQAAPQPHTATITDTAFTVAALTGLHYKLTVPPGATSVRVEGNFSATGGFSNDIEVALFSDDEFVNWQNHHPVTALYSSGRITQDTLNVNLPPGAGTYYLVFNNKFSLLTPKAVRASLRLHYNL